MTAPPIGPTPPRLPARAAAWKRIGLLLLLAAGAFVLFKVNPAESQAYPACPFFRLTGLHCPGCGTTRALHQLLHGRLDAAFGLNPFTVLLLPPAAYVLAVRALRAVRTPAVPPPLPRPTNMRRTWALVAIAFVFGVLRNLPWPPLAWMAP